MTDIQRPSGEPQGTTVPLGVDPSEEMAMPSQSEIHRPSDMGTYSYRHPFTPYANPAIHKGCVRCSFPEGHEVHR